jgi:hypothetical protein
MQYRLQFITLRTFMFHEQRLQPVDRQGLGGGEKHTFKNFLQLR